MKNMTTEECKEKVKSYAKYSIDSLEIAMNVIECHDTLNNSENEEIDGIYNKLSEAIKVLREIT